MIKNLGYIGIRVRDVPAWRLYAEKVLSLDCADTAGGLCLRMDEYSRRIAIYPAEAGEAGDDDVTYIGFEVADETALAALDGALGRAGIATARGGPGELAERGVSGLLAFPDPDGLRCEAYFGPSVEFERPFRAPRPMSGFVTGEQGLGHAVLTVGNIERSLSFFRDVLGFKLSDIIDLTRKGQVKSAYFLHCNGRHHTIALVEAPDRRRLVHFMLEVKSLDDVGAAIDAANNLDVPIVASLGRHVNDHMVSFYMNSPSGFQVEYGWGARQIDQATWTVQRHRNGSIWGHKGPMTE
jgi:2,3-dihydroxybiphenyl 1,2-dioxygenase